MRSGVCDFAWISLVSGRLRIIALNPVFDGLKLRHRMAARILPLSLCRPTLRLLRSVESLRDFAASTLRGSVVPGTLTQLRWTNGDTCLALGHSPHLGG